MKQGWEVKTLGEICEVLDSKRKPVTKRDRMAGEYPYYGATGILDYVDEYIFDEKLVLIGEDGAKWEAGEWTAFIAEGKYWVNNHAHVIRPNRSVVLDNWIVYFLYFSDLHKYVTGLTVPKLNQEKMRSITLPVPPIPEQQRIVAVLDEAFASIAQAKANAERNLVNARELFDAVQKEIFTSGENDWEEKRIDEVCKNLDSQRIPVTKRDRKEGKYPYYGASGIVDYVSEFIFDEDLLLVSEDGANLLARTYPIAFSISGKTWVNNHAHVLRFEKMETQKFVEYYLNSIPLDDYVSGMAQPKLNQAMLNSIVIPFPQLTEQRAIVERLEALSAETGRLEAVYRSKVAGLEELKKSVLQRAFEGELSIEN